LTLRDRNLRNVGRAVGVSEAEVHLRLEAAPVEVASSRSQIKEPAFPHNTLQFIAKAAVSLKATAPIETSGCPPFGDCCLRGIPPAQMAPVRDERRRKGNTVHEAMMVAPPIRMTLKWSVTHGESRPIVSALQGLMISTRAEAGCLGCSLSTEVRNRVLIHYTEEWNSEGDLIRQLRSDRFAALAELMEHSTEYPTMEFELQGATRGIDYAEEIRGVL